MQEVIAGRIDYLCPVTATALPNIESNQVKPIAMLSKSRPSILPKLATVYRARFFGHKFDLSGVLHVDFLPGETRLARAA